MLYVAGFIVVSYLAAVTIHELGHAGCCLILGFRLQMLSVWPLMFYRASSSWKSAWFKGYNLRASGFVVPLPLFGRLLRIRYIAVILAGPIISLAAGLTAHQLAGSGIFGNHENLARFLEYFALWSVPLGVLNLLPMKQRGCESDGRKIFKLLRGDSESLRLKAVLSLSLTTGSTRPREWDASLVSVALDDSIVLREMSPTTNYCLRWVRYNFYVDSRQTQEAEAALKLCLSEASNDAEVWAASWEAVWLDIFLKNDLESSRLHLATAMQLPDNPSAQGTKWRALAAIDLLDGRRDEAFELRAKANAACLFECATQPGMAQAIIDNLDDVFDRY